MSLNIKDIQEIIELMKETGLTEFEVEKPELKLRLRRDPEFTLPSKAGAPYHPMLIESSPATAVAGQPVVDKKEPSAAVKTDDSATDVIKSPMVGTFYRAASPESSPFVEVGQSVTQKTTVCIIEAMKIMNEIQAELKGTLLEALVENGQTVEFGQPLFKIKSE
jgi:acetyl-CoA carboxylase biotin carboxyl carrier protein